MGFLLNKNCINHIKNHIKVYNSEAYAINKLLDTYMCLNCIYRIFIIYIHLLLFIIFNSK